MTLRSYLMQTKSDWTHARLHNVIKSWFSEEANTWKIEVNQQSEIWILNVETHFSSNNKTESTNPNAPTQATSACVIATTQNRIAHDVKRYFCHMSKDRLQVVFAAAQQEKTHMSAQRCQHQIDKSTFLKCNSPSQYETNITCSTRYHQSWNTPPWSLRLLCQWSNCFWAWLQVRTQLPMHLLHSKKLLLWGQSYRSASPT